MNHTIVVAAACAAMFTLAVLPALLRRARRPDELAGELDARLQDQICSLFSEGRIPNNARTYAVIREHGGYAQFARQAQLMVKLAIESAKERRDYDADLEQMKKALAGLLSLITPRTRQFLWPFRNAAAAAAIFAELCVLWEGITIDSCTQ
jgi:hypothetical protein